MSKKVTKKSAKKVAKKEARKPRRQMNVQEHEIVSILTPEVITQIGQTVNGTHWSADMARACDVSKSYVSRVLDTSRKPDTAFARNLQRWMISRVEDISKTLDAPGMPGPSDAVKKAQTKIADAIRELRTHDPQFR